MNNDIKHSEFLKKLKPFLITVLHAQYKLQKMYEAGLINPRSEFDTLIGRMELTNSLIDYCVQQSESSNATKE